MTVGSFEPSFNSLPRTLPIFPLSGVLLLPRCRLPLNIFEPRYLSMTEAALGAQRMVGVVQPCDPDAGGDRPPLCSIGCAGRISSFSETDDGRYLVILTGVCRFSVAAELPAKTPFRQVVPDWSPYRGDLEEGDDSRIDRQRLFLTLEAYFEARGLDTDWQVLESSRDEKLVNSLSMSCPFDATQKQALLEAGSLGKRARLMISFMEMAVLQCDESASTH
ncbi:MAG: LON peptidase substrate-binding domain-containing protein [Acidobacteriota bacterium]